MEDGEKEYWDKKHSNFQVFYWNVFFLNMRKQSYF
jgi:hypothetical protein